MEVNTDEVLEDPKDYTKHIWMGVLGAVVLMVAVIAFQGKQVPNSSEVNTKHILISFNPSDPADRTRALERIQDIRQQIVDGASFDKMAEKYSQDPVSAKIGGHIGPQPRGVFDDNYEKYAWEAPENQLSEIIQSKFGYHLIVVTNRYISPSDEYEKTLDERVRDTRTEGDEEVVAPTEDAPTEEN